MAKKITTNYDENVSCTDYKVVVEYSSISNIPSETYYSDDLSILQKFAKSVSLLMVVKNVNIYSTSDNSKIKGY